MAYIHADELIDGFREFQRRDRVSANQLSNDELNQVLHTAMGKCFHPGMEHAAGICPTCKEPLSHRGIWGKPPDYCESLDAVAVVRDFTMERVGKEKFGEVVHEHVCLLCSDVLPENYDWITDYAMLSARQIASICFEALGLQENNDVNR